MSDAITFTYDRVSDRLYWNAMRVACQPVGDAGGRAVTIALWVGGWVVLVLILVLLMQLSMVQQGGIAFLIGMATMWVALMACGRLSRMRMQRSLRHEQSRRGPTRITAGPDGVHFTSSFGTTHLTWRAVDKVVGIGSGTALKTGLMAYPLPDDGLPPDVTPQAFRARLEHWRGEAAS